MVVMRLFTVLELSGMIPNKISSIVNPMFGGYLPDFSNSQMAKRKIHFQRAGISKLSFFSITIVCYFRVRKFFFLQNLNFVFCSAFEGEN